MNPPCQELVAKDLHGKEWNFRHIYRGIYVFGDIYVFMVFMYLRVTFRIPVLLSFRSMPLTFNSQLFLVL